MLDITTSQLARSREVSSDEFSESRGVVVTDGFGVTEGFQDRVGLNNLFFQGSLQSQRSDVSDWNPYSFVSVLRGGRGGLLSGT